jgi:hypothetical protein
VLESPELLKNSKLSILTNLLNGFSNADYKSSKNWEIIKLMILEHPLIHRSQYDVPWIKFALEMFSLDIFDEILVQNIFSLDSFEMLRLNERMQLLELYQSVRYLTKSQIKLPKQSQLDQIIELKLNFLRNSNVQEIYGNILADIFEGQHFVKQNLLVEEGKDLYLDFMIAFNKNHKPVRTQAKTAAEIKNSGLIPVGVFFLPKKMFIINYSEKLRGVGSLKFRILNELQIPYVYFPNFVLKKMDDLETLNYISSKIQIKLRDCS